MNFICDCCGKNGVDQYGNWCSECQDREYNLQMEDLGKWYNSCALCLKCAHSEGAEPNDYCDHYNMPLSMVKRKKKCKHYKEIDYALSEEW